LTPLKLDFLRAFFERERGFFLTGGSALGIFYLEHRLSYDLDLFSTTTVDWRALTVAFIDCAAAIRAEWRAISSSPYFHRFELVRGEEKEIIDFVEEKCPQLDGIKAEIGAIRVDTLREIGANKLCTILGRSDIKDLVDLYFLDQAGYNAIDHIDDAQSKDGGFDPATCSYVLSQMEINEIPQILIKPVDVTSLNSFLKNLQKQYAELAYPGK
jgi:hypothetical protein